MPRVGSSKIITSACVHSHFASTTFCWLPPDRLLAFCSDDGVILLQVCGEQDEVDRLMAALESTPGVTAKLMDLN